MDDRGWFNAGVGGERVGPPGSGTGMLLCVGPAPADTVRSCLRGCLCSPVLQAPTQLCLSWKLECPRITWLWNTMALAALCAPVCGWGVLIVDLWEHFRLNTPSQATGSCLAGISSGWAALAARHPTARVGSGQGERCRCSAPTHVSTETATGCRSQAQAMGTTHLVLLCTVPSLCCGTRCLCTTGIAGTASPMVLQPCTHMHTCMCTCRLAPCAADASPIMSATHPHSPSSWSH